MSSGLLRILAPLFRYSPGRDAWVLRGIGNRFGPVLRRRVARDAQPMAADVSAGDVEAERNDEAAQDDSS